MDAKGFFDAGAYFAQMVAANRLASGQGFRFCTCSGIETLQGPLDSFRDTARFVCLDDVNDGQLFQGRSGGFYKQRTFTVFLLHRYDFGDEAGRSRAMGVCRELFRQMMTRLLADRDAMADELVYLHVENVVSRELGQYFLNGCTGLYFMIDVSEPVDLRYEPGEWMPT